MNHLPFTNGRFPASGWRTAVPLVAKIRRAYRVAFPDHLEWGFEGIPLTTEGIRDALLRLKERFQMHLFPIGYGDAYLQSLRLDTLPYDFLDFIPFNCFGLDILFTEIGHYLNFPAPLDFLIYCLLKDCLLPEPIEHYFGECHYPFLFREDWGLQHLADLFQQVELPDPLSNIGLALEMLCGSTGNPWVDIDPEALWEMPDEFEIAQWTPGNVHLLKNSYSKGQYIETKIEELTHYFKKNGNQKLTDLLTLLQQTYDEQIPDDIPTPHSADASPQSGLVQAVPASTGEPHPKTISA